TLRIDPRDASRVQVIVDIDSSTPISDKTVAELSLQGVTGLLYIDLIANTGTRRLSKAVPSLKYPVIRSARSTFDAFLASLPELGGLASDVAERASRMLSDRNIASVADTLDNIHRASAGLPQAMSEIRSLVADLRSSAAQITEVAKNAQQIAVTAGPDL